MKPIINICFFFCFSFVFFISTASASDRMNEKELAACIMGYDPVSANLFVSSNVSKSTPAYNKLNDTYALGLRILALCETNTPVEKLPNWKKLQTQIKKFKGEATNVSDNSISILLCSSSQKFDGVMVPHQYDIVRRNSNNEAIVTSQYFDYHPELGSIPLPRDLRTVPDKEKEIFRKCQLINADGSLTDA